MNRCYLSTAMVFCFAMQIQAQGNVNIEFDDAVLSLPAEGVDLMQSDTLVQRFQLSVPDGKHAVTTSSAILPENVQLDNEKPQSFNVLNTFSLLKTDNSNLNDNIIVELGRRQAVTIVLPYLNSLSSLTPSFQTTGSHIFFNGKLWEAGSKVDFSSPAKVQVVAFNGDVRTYTIVVSQTRLPYFNIASSVTTVGKDWLDAKLSVNGTDEGSFSLKGKGSHFGEGLKNNYAIKFENKKSLLGITKNKRWLLVANEADKTLLRSQLGYWLAKQLAPNDWIPAAKPVNLAVNGAFVGCYTLVEQPRICKGRFEDGYLLSVEESAGAFEDAFRAKRSNTLFVFEDPETGSKGTALVRTKDKIDRFEKALEQQDWTAVEQMADLTSFANWLVVNEVACNTEAFVANTLVHVADNGKIAMLPAWELKKAFGCENGDHAGFVANAPHWMRLLLKNPSFLTLVKNQYSKVRAANAELIDYIDHLAAETRDAAIGNNAVWLNLCGEPYGASAASFYDSEVEHLKKWLENRLQWLDTQW